MMVVGVFGTPTPYGHWGFSAVRQVMQVVYGDHYHIHCFSLDELRQKWIAPDGKNVVITSDCPDTEMSDLFTTFDAPIIAFLDEPEDTMAFAKVSRDLRMFELGSFSTHCFCSLYDILLSPNTVCFTKRNLVDDVRDIFAKLLKILVGFIDPQQLEDVVKLAVSDYRPGQFTAVEDLIKTVWGDHILPDEAFTSQPVPTQDLIRAVSNAYRPIFQRKPLTQLICPLELVFTCNEGNVNKCLIDLTGSARFLFWGPYIRLPRGDWIAKIEIEVIDNFSGGEIEADIYDGNEIQTLGRTALPIEGLYSFELPFIVYDLLQLIQVRANLVKGAIEGKFGLRSLAFYRKIQS